MSRLRDAQPSRADAPAGKDFRFLRAGRPGDQKIEARSRRIVLLALGNDILGDDGVALAAARVLKQELKDDQEVEIIESSEAGLALMEILEGYEAALIVDSVKTGRVPAGALLEFSPQDFRKVIAPSPHYAGIPEVMEMAARLGIPFPKNIRILAMEVADPYEVREEMSEPVKKALPELVRKIRETLEAVKGGLADA